MKTRDEALKALEALEAWTRGMGLTSPRYEVIRSYLTAPVQGPVEERVYLAVMREAREALTWYAEQTDGCRKLGSIGEPYRNALDHDGGKRAKAALASLTSITWEQT